ncbi:MAG: PTS sugar transporter subunit IIB [Erysipelotrichaceae bacterium]|nr:PTS sugar transporter subunit IIB [Erysipelotrichaceae bacterium]
MIKCAICCGGGFSSSALMNNLKRQISEKGLENEISYEFRPFHDLAKSIEEGNCDFDVVMCCPHLKNSVFKVVKNLKVEVPLYILPPRMYGLVSIEELYEDAQDIVRIYAEKHENPFFFPGEENILRSQRVKSYRKTYPENL